MRKKRHKVVTLEYKLHLFIAPPVAVDGNVYSLFHAVYFDMQVSADYMLQDQPNYDKNIEELLSAIYGINAAPPV